METNRRGQAVDKHLAKRLDRHVIFLEKELAEVDRDIGQAIKPLRFGARLRRS